MADEESAMPGATQFPSDPAEFANDERISQSQINGLFVLEDEDGHEYEWIANRWVKTMDEELMKQHAEGYKVAGVDEDEPAINMAEKRKQAKAHAKAAKEQKVKEKSKRENTAIYVTGLPENASMAAIKGFFSQFGMIAESVDTGKQRVKLYHDEDGNFKGEALIVFQYSASVTQAVNLYDDAPFPTGKASSTGNMRIMAADESYKRVKDDNGTDSKLEGPVKSGRVFSREDRAKAKRKREEMDRRLADWGDEDPSAIDVEPDRWYERVVVVKHFFNRASMAQDIEAGYAADAADYLQQIYDDMLEEAQKFGGLEAVDVYDLEEPGIVCIEFDDTATAQACVAKFHGRDFDGRRLEAHTSDGTEMFRKSKKRKTSGNKT